LAQIDAATVGNEYASAEYNGLLYGGYSWQIAENLFSDLYVQYYSDWQTKFQTDRHNQNTTGQMLHGLLSMVVQEKTAVVLQKTKGPGLRNNMPGTDLKVYFYQRFTDYWGLFLTLRLIITSVAFLTTRSKLFI